MPCNRHTRPSHHRHRRGGVILAHARSAHSACIQRQSPKPTVTTTIECVLPKHWRSAGAPGTWRCTATELLQPHAAAAESGIASGWFPVGFNSNGNDDVSANANKLCQRQILHWIPSPHRPIKAHGLALARRRTLMRSSGATDVFVTIPLAAASRALLTTCGSSCKLDRPTAAFGLLLEGAAAAGTGATVAEAAPTPAPAVASPCVLGPCVTAGLARLPSSIPPELPVVQREVHTTATIALGKIAAPCFNCGCVPCVYKLQRTARNATFGDIAIFAIYVRYCNIKVTGTPSGSSGQAGVPACRWRAVPRCAALCSVGQLYPAAYMLAQIVAESHAPNLDVGGAGVACCSLQWLRVVTTMKICLGLPTAAHHTWPTTTLMMPICLLQLKSAYLSVCILLRQIN